LGRHHSGLAPAIQSGSVTHFEVVRARRLRLPEPLRCGLDGKMAVRIGQDGVLSRSAPVNEPSKSRALQHFSGRLGPKTIFTSHQRFPFFVRLLHRYYAAVRLLHCVHVRRAALRLRGPVYPLGRRFGGLPVLVHVVSRRARVFDHAASRFGSRFYRLRRMLPSH